MKPAKTERPILFSTAMVQAILDGRKTMTRRILKVRGCKPFFPDSSWSETDIIHWTLNGSTCPYGQPGDKFWVRETFTVLEPEHCLGGMQSRFVYKADVERGGPDTEQVRQWYIERGYPYEWKPSIHMPKEAARIWLEITNVRVERLQDISNHDALAEGVEKVHPDHFGFSYKDYEEKSIHLNCLYPRTSFYTLWTKINGKDSFGANPWVWVIEFKRIEPCH